MGSSLKLTKIVNNYEYLPVTSYFPGFNLSSLASQTSKYHQSVLVLLVSSFFFGAC